MKIREAVKEDFEQIWIIFQHIVSAGETYAYPVETRKKKLFKFGWSSHTKPLSALNSSTFLGLTI